jgi:hypothetical protein
MSFFCQRLPGDDSRLNDMTITQAHASGARMTAAFEVRAIDPGVLARLRVTDDAGHAPRLVTDEAGGSPLRCCLRASKPGDRIALVSYAPLRQWSGETGADPGPYDEVGPVFIHPQACGGPRGAGYPEDFAGWPRLFRAYRADGTILSGRLSTADEVGGQAAAQRLLGEIFADPEVAVVHARALEFGCFTFEIRRAPR